MKKYQYKVSYKKPGDEYETRANGYLEADSEDQAYDKANELVWDKYGWVNYVAVWVYEVEE